MNRRRGVAALGIAVAGTLFLWAFSVDGVLGGTVVLLGAAVVALGHVLLGQRRATARILAELGAETERAHQLSEHAWQSAFLAQVVDELDVSRHATTVLRTAAKALGSTLKASRVLVYARRADGAYRVSAQFASESCAPLEPDSELPPLLTSDRELAHRLSTSDLGRESDPELRALAERLQVRSMILAPMGSDHVLAVHQSGEPRSWTNAERRLVQRFADQLARALDRGEAHRRHAQQAEVHAGLLRFAQALSSSREPDPVLELACSVGAPLAGAHASAIFVDEGSSHYRAAIERGFDSLLSPSCLDFLESKLEESVRARAPLRIGRRASISRCSEMNAHGPLLLVPLFYGRESVGVFMFEKSQGSGEWSDGDVDVAEVLGGLTASALKNARLFEALFSSESRYAELYDNAPDLYQTLDGEGRILYCNLTEGRTLGLTKQDLVGERFERFLAPESIATWRRLERELFRSGYIRDAALELRAHDGRGVDVLVTATAVPATEERPATVRMVMRDVSELRRLEHELRQSQKLEVVGALAGGIAHDFNNVLGGILGYASLLHTHMKDRPRALRYVETIERSAVRGAELTGRLLSASRKAPARRDPVNLNVIVEETLELLAHSFHKKIRIVKRLDPRIRPMLADASQLQQVVLNLCVNARDAMPDGGLLRVETTVDDAEKRLRLSVEDSGVGIEPSAIERLFEPFFSTKGEGGTGLGLSVVYEIVTALGGDVRVKSSPGRGARFDIFLPITWVDEPDRAPELAEPVEGCGELILLVDDERVLREVGKEILESSGYRVCTAASGEDALDFLKASGEPVSLVILDLVMPGWDGGETFRRLRDVDTRVPVLLSSGLNSEEAVQDILAEGASGFIPKPFGADELTHAVHAALRPKQPPVVH